MTSLASVEELKQLCLGGEMTNLNPTRYEIAHYWILGEGASRFPQNKAICDLGEPCCFSCGYYAECWDKSTNISQRWEDTKLDKAHLQPRALGGPDTVDNIVLICQQCHDKAPDYLDPQDMLDWMSRQKQTHHLLEKYIKALEECKELGITEAQLLKLASSPNLLQRLLANKDKVNFHRSDRGGGLKASTLALIIRDALNYKEEYIQLNLFNHPKNP